MFSARGWTRLYAGLLAVAVLGTAACEEDNAAFSPLVDETPPVVSITGVSVSADTVRVTVEAEDFISLDFISTEIRLPDQLTTVITAEGDTILLGRLIGVDTTFLIGGTTKATINTVFLLPFAQATLVDIRAVAADASANEASDQATIIAGGGGTGGGLTGPAVSIFSPLPNQTVRDNTLIRVGVSASDPTGLAQLNVLLTGLTPATTPSADTIRFTEFRTDVDTLLDFFIPAGALGSLTITAEAINLNTISAFAQITVTVAEEVPDDSIPPVVSMLVTGGVQRRLAEPPRMEVDDSLFIDVIALDLETAITRAGVTLAITNNRPTGQVQQTLFQDSVFNPAISGTVPVRFAISPLDLPASLFSQDEIPDTLFFEVTAWAFDAAGPPNNCGATVDILGSPNSLACTSGDPVQAQGLQGGFTDRLIVAGRTVVFPQGALIADAVVDTIRELLLLADFEFGIVRPFDLRNEAFASSVPVGSEPWGLSIDNTEDGLLVANSGGTNVTLLDLGPRVAGAPAIVGEIDRFQTQDLKVYRVIRDFDAFGFRIFPTTVFDYSDRPQFIAQAANGLILFSTRPAVEDQQPGTIREYDPVQREIRHFIQYASRKTPPVPQVQIVNADSVFELDGSTRFKICDHTRGDPSQAARACIEVDSLPGARVGVDTMNLFSGWDVLVFSDLDIASIGLQDTTFVAASGDREFIAFGEGDTPERAGRIIMYRSESKSITNALQVSDLTGNAAQKVFGLALNNDGSLGVGRGEVAFYFGPDQPGGPNVLRLLGTNNNISPTGVGAALHPDHDQFSTTVDDERLSFLGSGDARIEMVDTHFFEFSRGDILIRDPVVGPLRITRRLPTDPPTVRLKLYGVTENGVVVIQVRDSDIDPIP